MIMTDPHDRPTLTDPVTHHLFQKFDDNDDDDDNDDNDNDDDRPAPTDPCSFPKI